MIKIQNYDFYVEEGFEPFNFNYRHTMSIECLCFFDHIFIKNAMLRKLLNTDSYNNGVFELYSFREYADNVCEISRTLTPYTTLEFFNDNHNKINKCLRGPFIVENKLLNVLLLTNDKKIYTKAKLIG